MNLSDWQALSGAYQPDRMARLEIAFRNLPEDPFGRVPAWAWEYAILKLYKMYQERGYNEDISRSFR